MLKSSEKKMLSDRLEEVINSISLLESTHPNHPALFHLRSERKWMEQLLKQTIWYKIKWKIKNVKALWLMSTVGIRIWWKTKVVSSLLNRVLLFSAILFIIAVIILYQGREVYHWDLFPNSDNPIDEWILGK